MDDNMKSKQELMNDLTALRARVEVLNKSEKLLRESEERYKRLIEHSPDIVWSFSDKRGTLYASSRVQAILGYSPDYLYRNPWLWNESIHPDDRGIVLQAITEFATGRDMDVEYRIKDAYRNWQWFRDRSIGRWTEGSETIIEGISTRITDQKRADEALKDREKELVTIYENAPLIILLVDKEWRIKKMNTFTSQLTGRSVGDMMDLRCGEALCCIHALDIPGGCGFRLACKDCTLRLAALNTIETGCSYHGVEIKMSLSNRGKVSEATFLLSATQLVIKEQPTALVSIQDITERKQAEIALVESEARYRSLFEHNPDAVYSLNLKGAFLSMNEAACQMVGYSREELMPIDFGPLLTPDDDERVWQHFEKAANGETQNYEVTIIRKDGRCLTLNITNTPIIVNGEIVGVYGIAQDITERKRVEAELRSSRKQLRALAKRQQQIREESRVMIAREIHDELGGGLTGLKMDLSWLLHQVSETEAGKDRIAFINKIRASNELIDQMIQVVRRIATDLRPPILDDLGLIAALEWQLQEFTSRTKILFEFISAFDYVNLEGATAMAVFRIFQEVLTNAARYSGAARITVHLREDEGSLFEAGSLILEIRDNGRGITEDEILDAKSLGLLGMKERALIFGGVVSVSGKPDEGTTVILKIPLKQEEHYDQGDHR